MDIITNFNVAIDMIDLTAIGTKLANPVTVSSTLAAASIGVQQTGGNTFVYVNTSAQTEALSAANMTMELQGNIALTAANIVHV